MPCRSSIEVSRAVVSIHEKVKAIVSALIAAEILYRATRHCKDWSVKQDSRLFHGINASLPIFSLAYSIEGEPFCKEAVGYGDK